MPPSAVISAKAQPMRTLTLAMAVMCYLATLALGGSHAHRSGRFAMGVRHGLGSDR